LFGKILRRRFAAALAAAAMACPTAVTAQSYPTKPVRLIATYPPGGSSDLMARILAQKLSDLWGQQVLVDNKPGAAGSIGMEYAAHQPPDGYAFVIGNLGPVAVNPLISKVPYEVPRDFIAVTLICTGPNILVVNSSSPMRSLQDVIATAKTSPGTLNFGSGGTGSLAHLAGEMLKRLAQIDIIHVPYKGGVLSVNDLMAGQVQLVFSDALPVMQPIRARRLRAIAMTGARRSPLAPDIPTFVELGYPGLIAVNWWGALLPAGTPRPIVDKLHDDLGKALATGEVREKFAGLGVEAASSTEEEFRAHIQSEMVKYGKLVQEAGIHAD
jgi:tripartite-type tricarboxylate transporter receptor subunit TctC